LWVLFPISFPIVLPAYAVTSSLLVFSTTTIQCSIHFRGKNTGYNSIEKRPYGFEFLYAMST
jgi:hypothetical protein